MSFKGSFQCMPYCWCPLNSPSYPPSRDMRDIRYRIEKLLQRQEDDELANAVVDGFGDLTIGGKSFPPTIVITMCNFDLPVLMGDSTAAAVVGADEAVRS